MTSTPQTITSADPRPVRWVVTENNPRQWKRYEGETCYPRSGWRRHAVFAESDTAAMSVVLPALCGLTPASGWGGDLFEDEMPECKRCARRLDMMDPQVAGAPAMACERCKRGDRIGRVRRFEEDKIKHKPFDLRESYRLAWWAWCYRCDYLVTHGLSRAASPPTE